MRPAGPEGELRVLVGDHGPGGVGQELKGEGRLEVQDAHGRRLDLEDRIPGAAADVEEVAALGLEPGDAQLLARYERWRSLDATTAMATASVADPCCFKTW